MSRLQQQAPLVVSTTGCGQKQQALAGPASSLHPDHRNRSTSNMSSRISAKRKAEVAVASAAEPAADAAAPAAKKRSKAAAAPAAAAAAPPANKQPAAAGKESRKQKAAGGKENKAQRASPSAAAAASGGKVMEAEASAAPSAAAAAGKAKSKTKKQNEAAPAVAAAPAAAGKTKKKSEAAAAAPAAAAGTKKKAPKKQDTTAAAAGSAKAKKPSKQSKKKPSKKQQQQQQEHDEDVEDNEEEDEQDEEQEQGEGQQPVHEQFMEVIAAREAELCKHCIILGQFDGDEDEASLEQLQALTKVFVPEQVQDDFIELWSELDDVGNESEEEGEDEDEDGSDGLAAFMKAFMGKFLCTQHSAQMHAILNSHLKAVDKALKAKSWQAAFCRWAAIVMAARRESHWWEDTDVPDVATGIYNKLRQQWSKLKARSDEELGGLVCEGGGCAKEQLGCYLSGMAEEMRGMDYEVQDV